MYAGPSHALEPAAGDVCAPNAGAEDDGEGSVAAGAAPSPNFPGPAGTAGGSSMCMGAADAYACWPLSSVADGGSGPSDSEPAGEGSGSSGGVEPEATRLRRADSSDGKKTGSGGAMVGGRFGDHADGYAGDDAGADATTADTAAASAAGAAPAAAPVAAASAATTWAAAASATATSAAAACLASASAASAAALAIAAAIAAAAAGVTPRSAPMLSRLRSTFSRMHPKQRRCSSTAIGSTRPH